MSNDEKNALIIIAILVVVVIALVILFNIIKFFVTHPFISGLIIGVTVGVGGALAGVNIRHWCQTHAIVEVKKQTK